MRFPRFEEEWDKVLLNELGEFLGGGTPSSSNADFWNGDIPWVSSSDLKENDIHFVNVTRFITEDAINSSATKLCLAPVILIVSRVGVGKVAYSSKSLCTSQDFVNIINFKCDGTFLSYLLSIEMRKAVASTQGTSIKGISSTEIKSKKIFIPSKEEQQKIASLLSLLDDRISTQNKIIQRLETLIKGICQSLANDQNGSGWKKQYLRDILVERKESNINNYTVHSVSVRKGVINQIEYLGRSFAAKDTTHYNVVRFGDIVYTKSPTGEFPYGIIKQSFIQKEVAVSPLYGVYEPKNIFIGNILHYYFNNPLNANNYLHSLVQKGAKNTISITNQHFLDNEIFLPNDINKAKNIAMLLNSINGKKVIEEDILNNLTKQKQYLLQQMFI